MQQQCSIHVYDDTIRFLDFVSEQAAFAVRSDKRLLIVSQNVSLETIIKHYNSQTNFPRLIYGYTLFYKALRDFQKIGLVKGIHTEIEKQSVVIIDIGSLCGQQYTIQQLLGQKEDLVGSVLCFDARMLSPAELIYLLSNSPCTHVNNQLIQPQPREQLRVPPSMKVDCANGLVNSTLLELTLGLTQTTQKPTDDLLQLKAQRIESQQNLNAFAKNSPSRDALGDTAFLYTDQMLNEQIMPPPLQEPVVVPNASPAKVKRVFSKTFGSKINLAQMIEPQKNQEVHEDNEQITITFDKYKRDK